MKKSNKNIGFKPLFIAVAVIAVALIVFLWWDANQKVTGLNVLPEQGAQQDNTPEQETTQTQKSIEIDPSSFAVRQKYFEEAFKPKREEYNLFEKAADFLNIPLNDVPDYFSLNSEHEIFAELPPLPKDFSEIAYLLASGRTYSIGNLSENYYMQPEFYPGFKEQGLKYWTKPNPKYWTTNGYGSYPAEQLDTLSLSGRQEFVGAVFFYTGYGVQTYQGVTIVPTSESLKYFDISITPSTFLLTPVFPKFSSDWAHKLKISGKLKPGTPAGEYAIGFMVVQPPKEKMAEWESMYRNLYFNAANAIAPSNYPIKFIITVEE